MVLWDVGGLVVIDFIDMTNEDNQNKIESAFRKAIYSSFLLFSFNFADNDYWQQSVNYKMDVILVDSVRQLACSSTITYKNNSPDKLSNIYMHLYP